MTWKENLISLYLYISDSKSIKKYLQSIRQSNNTSTDFTDEEVMTLYIFGILQNLSTVKQIYKYSKEHLLDWFPKLPSYQAFDNRLNRLPGVFAIFVEELINKGCDELMFKIESLIDSMPIIVAGNKRSSFAKTANDICNKSYCSSKSMYYYGVKLHLLGFVRPSTIPMPEYCWLTSAEVNDLTAAKDILGNIRNRKIFGDKIYFVEEYSQKLFIENNTLIITPIKKSKGQILQDAADNLYSTAVSRVRQPIESIFNWINEKTQIQNATKVRSSKGLLVHVWGKLAAALSLLTMIIFNP